MRATRTRGLGLRGVYAGTPENSVPRLAAHGKSLVHRPAGKATSPIPPDTPASPGMIKDMTCRWRFTHEKYQTAAK